MLFPFALNAVLTSQSMARRLSWPEGMVIFLVPGSEFEVNRPPLNQILENGEKVNYQAHVDIMLGDGRVAVYNPSMLDLVADNWEIVHKTEEPKRDPDWKGRHEWETSAIVEIRTTTSIGPEDWGGMLADDNFPKGHKFRWQEYDRFNPEHTMTLLEWCVVEDGFEGSFYRLISLSAQQV